MLFIPKKGHHTFRYTTIWSVQKTKIIQNPDLAILMPYRGHFLPNY